MSYKDAEKMKFFYPRLYFNNQRVGMLKSIKQHNLLKKVQKKVAEKFGV